MSKTLTEPSRKQLPGLSDDAKSIAGALFGLPKSDRLHIRRPSRLTHRAADALAELIKAGILRCVPITTEANGPVNYLRRVDCKVYLRWWAANMKHSFALTCDGGVER